MNLWKNSLIVAVLGLSMAVVAAKADAGLYDIKFRLTSDVTLESLQLEVDYTAAGGEFVGLQGDVDCASNASINAMEAFRDDDPQDLLHQGLINISGIDGPVRVVTCTFDASSEPAKGDFNVTVVDWSPDVGSTPTVKVAGVVAQ